MSNALLHGCYFNLWIIDVLEKLLLLFLFAPLAYRLFDSSAWFFTQVIYDTTGFLEKNRDLLHLDSIELLSSCSCHLPQIFASNMLSQSNKPVVGPLYKAGGADSQKLSVATKFKVQVLCFTSMTICTACIVGKKIAWTCCFLESRYCVLLSVDLNVQLILWYFLLSFILE